MAGPTSVRFCNEMLELCGYQEDALNKWKQRIQEGDSCTREQYIQIEKEQQALREIQAKITDYFKVRAKFDEEFETAFEVPKRSLFGHTVTFEIRKNLFADIADKHVRTPPLR